jgi:formate hydrogenlyase subunit 3/multisubunit Na+/H+ antiporter MnhD subunit
VNEPLQAAAAILLVMLPLAAAPIPFLSAGRGARTLAALVLLGQGGALVACWLTILGGGVGRVRLGGHAAPLGIELRVDGLATILLALTWLAMAGVWLYESRLEVERGGGVRSGGSVRDPARTRRDAPFWSLMLFLWASLDLLYLSNDLFNVYVGLELLGLSAVALVCLAGGREALEAGFRYLLVSIAGSLFYLVGVGLLYGEYGGLALDGVGASLRAAAGAVEGTAVRTSPSASAALALMTFGLALKTALFPFHGWLPRAHASAPSAVSALLSAIVVKASFYVLLRLWTEVFPGAIDVLLVQLVGFLGAIAIAWGALLAMQQERLKLMIAFSTVSQLGYLFVLFPVALDATPLHELATSPGRLAEVVPLEREEIARLAWQGGVLFLVAHAAAKAALFLCAGNLIGLLGHDRIEELSGVARRAPGTALALGLAGISLIGLPPSGGFSAKWMLVTAAIERSLWSWAWVMVAGSVLTSIYVFRLIGMLLRVEAPDEEAPPASKEDRLPRSMTLAALGLAAAALASGLWPKPIFELLEMSRGFPW